MDGGLSGRATFVFPLQPGDRRFVQTTFEEILGRYGMRLVPGMALSAYWLEGDAEPTLVGY
jgi:hypothetical protein